MKKIVTEFLVLLCFIAINTYAALPAGIPTDIELFERSIAKLNNEARAMITSFAYKLYSNPGREAIDFQVEALEIMKRQEIDDSTDLNTVYVLLTKFYPPAEKERIRGKYYAIASQQSESKKLEKKKAESEAQKKSSINPIKFFIDNHRNLKPHEILSVQENASIQEINEALKRLRLKYHPDRHAGNTKLQSDAQEAMKIINEARNAMLKKATPLTAATPQ